MHMSVMSLAGFFFFLASASFGAEIVEEGISVKALGMGNAYLTHGKGHDAIYYNPAGLASMSGFRWRVMGLDAGINGLDSYSEYADMVEDSDDLPSVLNQLYGRPVWARLDLQSSFSWGPFIVGGSARSNAGFVLMNPALPTLQSAYFADYNYFAGLGLPLIPGFFDGGFIVKRTTRYSSDAQIGASTLGYLDSDVLEDSLQKSGTGYGLDIGAKLKLPVDWNPTFSFAWRDVGQTKYYIAATSSAPAVSDDNMSAGLGLEKNFGLIAVRPAIDGRYLNRDDVQLGKKLHCGIELEFPVITLRGGYNQGYYTAGATFDFWIFEIDLATYGTELGVYPGQHEDRRYMLQLVTDFSAESISGDWFSVQKSRRKGLKQRR